MENETPTPTPETLAAKNAMKSVVQAAEVFYDAHLTDYPNMEARRNAIANAQVELLNQVGRWRRALEGMKGAKTS